MQHLLNTEHQTKGKCEPCLLLIRPQKLSLHPSYMCELHGQELTKHIFMSKDATSSIIHHSLIHSFCKNVLIAFRFQAQCQNHKDGQSMTSAPTELSEVV